MCILFAVLHICGAQALLQKDDVMEQVFSSHARDDGVFRDFCDGTFVKNYLSSQLSDTLLLSFYFDELEVANPLGSKRGKHKLGQ